MLLFSCCSLAACSYTLADKFIAFSWRFSLIVLTLSISFFSKASFSSLTIFSTSSFSLLSTLSPKSFKAFSDWKIICSASFLKSASSFFFLSASLLASASFIILSISSSDNVVLEVIVIFCSLLVPKSLAVTLTIPLASISNVTWICGTPLGAGGISDNWNLPSVLLSLAIDLSPCNTCTSTAGWLSAAVENTCFLLVGIVVFFGIKTVIIPPKVSSPSESGVTSSNTISFTSPVKTPPWIAAPIATTSSGLTSREGSFPSSFLINSCTIGIRVDPPTNRTLSISLFLILASLIAWRTGPSVDSTKSRIKSSNLARVSVKSKCSGPSSPWEINGADTCVEVIPDKSFLAFSATSFSLCIAILSLDKSTPFSFLNCSTK